MSPLREVNRWLRCSSPALTRLTQPKRPLM